MCEEIRRDAERQSKRDGIMGQRETRREIELGKTSAKRKTRETEQR